MPIPILVIFIIVLPLVIGSTTGNFWLGALSLIVVLLAHPIVRVVRKNRYFASDHFQSLKAATSRVVAEHNEVVGYVDEIRARGSFQLGRSSSGQHAHLASFENTSSWNYRRDRNIAEHAPHVHNASLQVVRNASNDPIKYLMKYFSVKADPQTLADVQGVADDISRLEEAVSNIKSRELDIAARINPPRFILKFFADEFWEQVGARLSPIEVPYPQYRFQYTSAGGNSGQVANIKLDSPTLEALSSTLVEKIRWAKSAAGQRSLMTNRLRRYIKARDGHACVFCGAAVAIEPNLLLEVDHIVPVSRGGLSTPDNLQTLCWRCNRSKGAKLVL